MKVEQLSQSVLDKLIVLELGKKTLPPGIQHLTMASGGCRGENIHGNTLNAPHPLLV